MEGKLESEGCDERDNGDWEAGPGARIPGVSIPGVNVIPAVPVPRVCLLNPAVLQLCPRVGICALTPSCPSLFAPRRGRGERVDSRDPRWEGSRDGERRVDAGPGLSRRDSSRSRLGNLCPGKVDGGLGALPELWVSLRGVRTLWG